MGHPSVYPTGVTVYDPARAFGGYTLFQAPERGALLIDMNGREVQLWHGLEGFPNKLLPGGHVFGSTGQRDPRYGLQDQLDLISPHPLLDDKIIEVDWQGQIIWEWRAHEHIEELGFDEAAREVLRRDPNLRALETGAVGDWLHLNSLSALGPNRHYQAGDRRFHPDNLIWSAREANIIAIVDKETGRIVWRLGPSYRDDSALEKLGWIIGQHHPHLIPEGLPGAGNLLVFDNGGWAGYGRPHPSAPSGRGSVLRDYSRVLEIDPQTLEVVWQYTPAEAGFVVPLDASRFYSPFISSAQRLPNGNTLITEGSDGRLFEVTRDHQTVWEYVNPYWRKDRLRLNLVYRAYRAPYAWVPQLERPREQPVPRLDPAQFRVPGAAPPGSERSVQVQGVEPQRLDATFCVPARS
jgi:Arylsulfotransferase (ASST)